jgi:uncharacterized sulfatase
MKKIIICGMIILFLTLACSCSRKPIKPNILFIMSDDHAMAAISAYNSRLTSLAPTPNIDRIAREGALFYSNYCCNSISGPSRAAILTGKHSHKNGFMRNQANGFDGSQQTLPKIMQANGYQTAIVGKWHLVSTPTGFDHWRVLHDQGDYNNPVFFTATDTIQYSGYVTDLITQFTKEWLDNRDKSKPFFLMMHHKAPHRNWIPAERHYHLYENTVFPVPENYFDDYEGRKAAGEQKMSVYRDMFEGHDLKMVRGIDSDSLLYDPWPHAFMEKMTDDEKQRFFAAYRERNNDYYTTPRNEEETAEWKLQRYLQDYLATIKSVDESVGAIMEYLEQQGLDKNTVLVYTSDQGFYLGEHGWFDKRFMYEESFIMPLAIRYPIEIKAGAEIRALTQNIDFAPTFLDLCGMPVPDEMQGVSFRPLLSGKMPDDWRKSLYYHYYEYPAIHSVKAHCGVKTERYKLMHFYKENDWELFDLQNDPYEMNNIYGKSGTEPIAEQLKQELKRLQAEYEVPEELTK